MAYLDEAGLAALVGKVKGQMVELTAEEYAQIDPAKKNYDNKLYFVKDEAYTYPIDNEPTANSDFLVKSGGVYNWTSKIGSGALTTNAKTLIPAVNELNNKLNNVIAGTVTMLVTGNSNLLVRQCGHIVAIWGYFTGLTLPANTRTDIAKISGVSLPTDSVRLRGVVGNNAYSVGSDAYIIITTDGAIGIVPEVSGSAVYFNATYIR